VSGLLRCASPRRLQVALGLVMGLVFASSASAAAPLDTVTVTGSAQASYSNIDINAQSGTSGQSPSGTASFTVLGAINVSGPVTCLSVTGPDQGGGTVGSPTTSVLNFQDPSFGVVAVQVVDNGGNGADVISTTPIPGRAPTDCSPFSAGLQLLTSTLTNGRGLVFDAPLVPTSKDQCRHDGWRNYPQFESQRQCIRFVEGRR
jgi:hypothetical protein